LLIIGPPGSRTTVVPDETPLTEWERDADEVEHCGA